MTINCNGHLIDLSQPKIMGILNVTPDSFYDGGKYKTDKSIARQVEKMLVDGAAFIDVGAYSSRPGAKDVSIDEELQRIIPIIELLTKEFKDIVISVDTFRSEVASESIETGAALVNDISGGMLDDKMYQTIAEYQVPYILMHMQGTPQTMQLNPQYENITKELITFFAKQIFELRKLNVNDVIIDAGFGFGKTLNQNYELLKNLKMFKHLDVPILAGISRKSMLYKPLEISAKESLNATTVANTIALMNGSNILRVHDVKEAVEAIKIITKLH